MKLKIKKYKSIVSVSILMSLGIGTTMINSYEGTDNNIDSSKPIQQINSGRNHSSIITSSGELWMWGSNLDGELGDLETSATVNHRIYPINITKQEGNPLQGMKIEQTALGSGTSAAIDSNGDLWTWGATRYGVRGMGNGSDVFVSVPTSITQQEENPLEGAHI